jgi:hypothetical protein
MIFKKINSLLCATLLVAGQVHLACATPSMPGNWVPLSSDAPDNVRSVITAEVEKVTGYATIEESDASNRALAEEKEREDSLSKATLMELEKRFKQVKRVRDSVFISFSEKSGEYEESRKNLLEATTAVQNQNNKISLCEKEILSQQEHLKKYLKTEKQGEALAAVIHTQGMRDTLYQLNRRADELSAPELVAYMGTSIQSYTEVVGGVLSKDFVRSITEGTAKPVNEEPVRIQLDVTNRGTEYLRVKRYELYLFQEAGQEKKTSREISDKSNVAIVFSLSDLERLLSQHGYQIARYDTSRISKLIGEVTLTNRQQNEALKETVTAIQERITSQRAKISDATADRDRELIKKARLEEVTRRLATELDVIRKRREAAEADLAVAQSQLNEKKRVSETIILKFALQASKGGQSPADASIEAIIDKLEEVKNEARVQHSRESVEVTSSQLTSYEQEQSSTEAKVTAVRLIALTNEGSNGVRVRVAFRVRTIMADSGQKAMKQAPPPLPSQQEQKKQTPAPDRKKKPAPKPRREPVTKIAQRDEEREAIPDDTGVAVERQQEPEGFSPARDITLTLARTLTQHSKEIKSLTMSSDGSRAASGDSDNSIILWDARTWTPLATLKGHRNNVQALCFSASGRYLASGSSDETAIIWDVARKSQLRTIKTDNNVNALAFSPAGNQLAIGPDSNKITVWNPANGTQLRSFTSDSDVLSLAFSPNGQLLATAGKEKNVRIWNLSGGDGAAHILEGHGDDVRALLFTPGGRQLITAGEDKSIIVWNVANGSQARRLTGHRDTVVALAITRDGNRLISADSSRRGTIIVWDFRSGAMLKRFEIERRINHLSMSPTGRSLVVGSDESLLVYRLE